MIDVDKQLVASITGSKVPFAQAVDHLLARLLDEVDDIDEGKQFAWKECFRRDQNGWHRAPRAQAGPLMPD
jgi:hypothetical protein